MAPDRVATMRDETTTRLRLLVMTSTYPRWANDPEPAFVHELCRRLVSRFDVTVLCPHASGSAIDEVLDGVQVHRYRYAPSGWETLVNDGGILGNLNRHSLKWLLVPGFMIGQWLALLRLRRRWRPDLVHAHWLLPQGIIAVSARATPLVVTSHGADLFALRGGLFRALRSWVVARTSAITVASEAMRERLRLECPHATPFAMPMGVDLNGRFKDDQRVPRSPGVILAVGRLVEKKGLVYLIEAMPAVLEAHPGARLDVVGFGPERERLAERVRQLGLDQAVNFLGSVAQPDLPRHYQSAAVFVAPFVEAASGDQEGLGLVVAEAIGCLCPVIVGDVPAVHDFLGTASECIVPQRDADALAAAIIRVLEDPSEAQARAMERREAVRLKFSWDVVAENYAGLLSGILQEDHHDYR
jgi:glycosyltransferase involved in cell wall biosynthesis